MVLLLVDLLLCDISPKLRIAVYTDRIILSTAFTIMLFHLLKNIFPNNFIFHRYPIEFLFNLWYIISVKQNLLQ